MTPMAQPAVSVVPSLPRVVVLGGGPAGLAAAHHLALHRQARVDLLEQQTRVGGNAGSFELEGIWCDYGSHRLHPVIEPRLLADLKALLGDELLWRPRHGRILLQGRWIHFPLKPIDLALRLPKGFAVSLVWDAATKKLRARSGGEESFATVLEQGLGPSMSHAFYYPYVRKLWGLDPTELSVTLARRRVSGNSFTKMLAKVLRQIPGFGAAKASGFYFPKRGYGLISERLAESARRNDASVQLGASVTAIRRDGMHVRSVGYEKDGQPFELDANAVWSTLPLTQAVRMMDPPAPIEVQAAASHIRFRGMILVYLVLDTPQFTPYDAHYFPEPSVPISRMSEPKNYHATKEPLNRTVLCAELPADASDPWWRMSDDELGRLYCEWLGKLGLPVTVPVVKTVTRRLRYAYPVYDRHYEGNFRVVDRWLSELDGFLSYGRQGLFAHDNTHHAMTMAYAACACLGRDGSFDRTRWAEYRREFESHVVED